MLAFALSVVAAASPMKVAVTGVAFTGGDATEGQAYVDFFAQKLGDALGTDVTTPSQVAGVLGLERQKQLLGCADGQSQCLAELAGAMGVDFIVTGTMAKLDGAFTVSLKLVEVSSGRAKQSASTRAPNAESLSEWLDQTARAWGGAFNPVAPGPGVLPILLGGVSAGLAVTAGVLFGLSQVEAGRLRRHDDFMTGAQIVASAAFGQTTQTLGWVFGGLAVAGAVGTVLSIVLKAPSEAVSVWCTPDGGGLLVKGVLP